MKKFTLFFLAFFAALSAFAINFSGNLYLTPHSEWRKDNARFAAYFFSGDKNVWVSMSAVESTDMFVVTVPEGAWSNVIFCRMNPGVQQNGWDTGEGKPYWGGKTKDLSPVDGMDHYIVDSKSEAYPKDGGAVGSWSKYDSSLNPDDHTNKEIFSGDIYLTPHTAWTADNARFAAYFFTEGNGPKKELWVGMTKVNPSDVYVVSVPEGSWENVIFCRMNPNVQENSWDTGDGKPFWNGQTQDLKPAKGLNHYVVDSSSDAWKKPSGLWKLYDAGSNPEPNPNPDPDVDPEPNPDIEYTSSVPSQSTDVMIQAFYWDSNDTEKALYGDTRWTSLTAQASELAAYFDLIWLPPSSKSEGGLGYHPVCWSEQNSGLGNERMLRTLIERLHANGSKVIADIVVNHRGGKSGWLDFYADDFGEFGRFQFTGEHICKNDEVNSTPGKGTATGADDTGENYAAARDLDHTNAYVRDAVKAYLKWLQKEFKYDGFRYDVAKGFAAEYFGEYNRDSKAPFSVGEFLDGNVDLLKKWIEGTGKNSLAFDFATKFTAFNQGIAAGNFTKLKGAGLLGAGYSKYAVTLIDNHDTFERSNGNDFAAITDKDKILQANAYLLSMPGIPCVFYPHWAKYKEFIKPMIDARRTCGIHSESRVHDENVANDRYEATIDGLQGSLILKVGPGASVNDTPAGYIKAASGNGYAIFTKTSSVVAPRLIVSPEGGIYEGGTTVKLTSTNLNADIYYTLDGTEPNSSSSLYSEPIEITKDSTVLKAFAEFEGSKSEIQEHLYLTKIPVRNEGIKVSFYKPDDWNAVYLWAWDDDDNNLYGGASWPGKSIKDDGNGWWSYTFSKEILYVNVVFNNGDTTNCSQTGDMVGIEESTCYYFTGHKYKPGISVDCKTVGVEQIEDDLDLMLYPNPVRDQLYLETGEEVSCVYIYSVTGLQVKSVDVDADEVQIYTGDLPNGLYFMRCQMENGNVAATKFIKQ